MVARQEGVLLELTFEAEVIHWRGPSPFFFAPLPPAQADELERISRVVSYGWGMIPVEASIQGVGFRTSLFPRDGTYLLPIKAAVRKTTGLTAGDRVLVALTVEVDRR